MKPQFFRDQSSFRAWLARHYGTSSALGETVPPFIASRNKG